MSIFAVDPGTHDSAFCLYDGQRPIEFGIVSNSGLLTRLYEQPAERIACEMIQCQGMPVGLETFETAYFIGELMSSQRMFNGKFHRVYRSDVKSYLCGSMKAKDSNIRQALVDKFGGKDAAIGKKASAGPLYGISSHVWSALAIAVTWWESEKFAAQRTGLGITSRTGVAS